MTDEWRDWPGNDPPLTARPLDSALTGQIVQPIITTTPATVFEPAQIGIVRPPTGQTRRVAVLADSAARFSSLLQALAQHRPRAFGLDTETANFERGGLYRESPSLLQLAFRQTSGEVRVAVVDLQAIRDVRPLQPFFLEQSAVVFAHNYTYDERMLTKLGLRPRCVYDTCRAARVLYEGAARLADLSERLLGTPMDKELQVSDWGRRPLSREQIAYAARDAADTLLIGEIVRDILPDAPPPVPALPPNTRAAYTALLAWRQAQATAGRKYPEDILPQRTLREIAARRPTSPAALRTVAGMGETRIARYAGPILETLASVELAALVEGTPYVDLHISVSELDAEGLRVRLILDGVDAAAAERLLFDAPPTIRQATRQPHPWRFLRPVLAGLRLSCARPSTPPTSGTSASTGKGRGGRTTRPRSTTAPDAPLFSAMGL